MATSTEYAKLITHYVPGTIYGLRAVVTIPTETQIGVGEHTNGNGFFDAYLSLDRKGGTYHYECGLSQEAGQATFFGLNKTPGGNRWHWMYAAGTEGSNGGSYNFTPGQQVPIELSINSSGGLDFIVNYTKIKTFTSNLTTSDGITNARLVLGACDEDFGSLSNLPNPLTSWGTLTTQISCGNYAYQSKQGGSWALINPGTAYNRVYWPQGYTHQTNPQDWTVATSNGNLTASLKKF